MTTLRDILDDAVGAHEAVAVEAPTGSGKTTTAYERFRDRDAIMVLPTRMAIQNVLRRCPRGRARLLTPMPAIEQMTRSVPSIVILDEAHTTSREYESLLRFLRRLDQRPRLVFLSAMIDEARLSGFFPGLAVIRLPPARKYPIGVSYHPTGHDRVPGSFALIQEIDLVLKTRVMTLPAHERAKILCFVASHEQCDRLVDITKHEGYEACALHGGMSEEEVGEVRERLADPRTRTICFATNMVETAVTLPGLRVVIDSGIRTTIRGGNRLVQEWCDRSSMIQRAGRTGRTCPGRVIRMMSEQQYEALPLVHYPQHNFEPVVMFFLSRGIEPEKVLGGENAEPCLRKFREMDVPAESHHFLARCGVDVEVGLPAFYFFRGRAWDGLSTGVCLALALVQMYRNQPMNWVYIDKKFRLARERARIRASIGAAFGVRGDMLGSVVNVFTAVYAADKPAEFCKEHSLNYRVFRETRRVFHRLASAVSSGRPLPPPREAVRGLWPRHEKEIIGFLWRWFPRFDTRHVTRQEPAYLETRSLEIGFGWQDRPVLELVRKNDELVTLWTRYPLKDYREDHRELAAVMEGHRKRMDHRLMWRWVFGGVVREIREEVAFRPGMCGMEAARTDFFSHCEGR